MNNTTSRRNWICGALAVACGSAWSRAAGPWLLREWELTYDPDGDPRDFIEFFDGGQVIHTSAKGRRTTGAYLVRGEEVRVTFVLPNGKTLGLVYDIARGGRQLKLRSSKTGAVAIYEPRRR